MGTSFRSRSQYSEQYSRSSPFQSVSNSGYKNPKVAQYFDEKNYKNNQVNHAYSFGGTTSAKQAWKDPTVVGAMAENPLLRPSSSSSYRRKEAGYNVVPEVDDMNQVYNPNARKPQISPNKPPRAGVMRYSNTPMSRQSEQSMTSSMARAQSAERQGRYQVPAQSRGNQQSRQQQGSRPLPQERPASSNRPVSKRSSQGRPGSAYSSQKAPSYAPPQSAHVDFMEINHDEDERVDSGEELYQEEIESVADLPERPQTSSSWKTTASQRQYIEMLETLLREEREKRLSAEDQLKSAG